MSHIDIPEGYKVLRFKVEGEHFDIAVPEEEKDHIIEQLGGELGAALVSDDGLDLDKWQRGQPVSLGKPNIGEMIAKLNEMGDPVPVPHLRKYEYADRPMLDLGPVAHPQKPQKARRAAESQREKALRKKREKRRRKKKQAKKSRRKNRK